MTLVPVLLRQTVAAVPPTVIPVTLLRFVPVTVVVVPPPTGPDVTFNEVIVGALTSTATYETGV